ncbi:hypothetical protein [Nocardia sp. NPDC048505]|uniref:hypothetical protein n=1 Tax=unclassified Nocardia TaxID=2637762 RepID=UPI0033EDC7C9
MAASDNRLAAVIVWAIQVFVPLILCGVAYFILMLLAQRPADGGDWAWLVAQSAVFAALLVGCNLIYEKVCRR